MTPEERLLSKRVIDTATGCWNWTGHVGNHGYGVIRHRFPKKVTTHRLSAHLFLGMDLDSDLCVLHRCDNRICFNPEHLFLGTREMNQKDMAAKGRSASGERSASAKLTVDLVRDIKDLIRSGERDSVIARKYKMNPESIRQIRLGNNWKHV